MNHSDLSSSAVEFSDVSVTLAGVHILDGVTAAAPRGGCTAIVGPNGAGKTTLLLALLKQVSFDGKIHITPCANRPPRIGYIPQRLQFDRSSPLTVTDFLIMGIQRMPLWLGKLPKQRKAAQELLTAIHSEELANRPLGALSGGELQRVLLALALQQKPELLVLDEPAAGVDIQGGHLFCELLERLRAEHGFTQLMVSHDLATVTHHATHVIMLNHHVIAEGAPKEVLTESNLTAVFGMHMGLADAGSMPDGRTACTCSAGKEASDA